MRAAFKVQRAVVQVAMVVVVVEGRMVDVVVVVVLVAMVGIVVVVVEPSMAEPNS
jgi:hypothetical protein